MAKSKGKTDWWEILLYGGIFILAVIFLYQLMKAAQATGNLVTGLFSQIPTALSNTVAAVESALTSGATNAITSPLSWLTNLFNLPLLFLGTIWSIFQGFLGLNSSTPSTSLTGGNDLGSGFSLATPIDQGNGSAYPGTTQGVSVPTYDGGSFSAFLPSS